jgi:multidrug resistance efflux pump
VPVGQEVFASGVVEGRCREIALGFELTGRVLAVQVQEGDRVRKGDLLARLDDSLWQQELAEAEANLALAKAERERLLNGSRKETRRVSAAEVAVAQVQAKQARKTFERSATLVQGKLIARQQFDDHEADLMSAEARLGLAEAKAAEVNAAARDEDARIADAKLALQQAQVEHARTKLSMTQLLAPCDGVILRVETEPGELVAADQSGRPLVTMTDISQLRVRAFVEELDAVRIVTGTRASVAVDGMPDCRLHGAVISCSPCMVPKTQLSNRPGERVDVKVREVLILLDNQDALSRLMVGLPVDVYVRTTADGLRSPIENGVAGQFDKRLP